MKVCTYNIKFKARKPAYEISSYRPLALLGGNKNELEDAMNEIN